MYSVDYAGDEPAFSVGSLPVPVFCIEVMGGEAVILWPTVPSLRCQLTRADTLEGPWNAVGSTVVGDGGEQQFGGGEVSSESFAFWRIDVAFE